MSLTYDNIRNCFPDSESTEWPWTDAWTVSRAAPEKMKKNSDAICDLPIGKTYNIRSTWNSDGKGNFLAFSPGI